MLEPGAGVEEAALAGQPESRCRSSSEVLRVSRPSRHRARTHRRAGSAESGQLRGTPAIVTLLEDLRRGVPFASAFYQRLSMRYEDFQLMVERQ